MASYYPEGECFFKRSSLVYSNYWSAEKEDQFYSHVLVEYYWNGWVAKAQTSTFNPIPIDAKDHQHARSKVVLGGPSFATSSTMYALWDKFYVGESVERDVKNMLAISSYAQSDNFNECRDRDGGGPLKYVLQPIPIRNKKTQWLWIDGTIPIRAVYFPVCHKSDEAFSAYCTYVVIDFRARQSVDLTNTVGQFRNYRLWPQYGLGYVPDITFGFNIPNIITYLTLPRQFRNPTQGLYRTGKAGNELVVRASSERFWECPNPTVLGNPFVREMDLARIISVSFGIQVGWRPYVYSSFILTALQRCTELGLSFVPGVGPLLSVGLGIGLQLLADPASFKEANVLDLSEAVLVILLENADKGRKFLAPKVLPGMHTVKAATRAKRSAALTEVLPTNRSAPVTDVDLPTDGSGDLTEVLTEMVPTNSSALTEDERKASKVAGDAVNTHLTELLRQMQGGEDPPQSTAWLKRIADGAATE